MTKLVTVAQENNLHILLYKKRTFLQCAGIKCIHNFVSILALAIGMSKSWDSVP